MQLVARAAQTVPDWAIGCCDRAYLSLDGAERDRSIAIWIQTESQYFDLRIPHDRPRFPEFTSLSDFDRSALLQLGRQSGDTGTCVIENQVATWTSWGDRFGFYCNDVAIFPDDGRLDPKSGTIYEYDTPKSEVRYEEAWVQQPYDHGLVAHLTLCDEDQPDGLVRRPTSRSGDPGDCNSHARSSGCAYPFCHTSRHDLRDSAVLDQLS